MRQLQYALRKLLKTPLFTGVAILCLALGIGANSAIFSLINTIILKPLPFFDVSRVTFMGDVFEGPGADGQRVGVTPLNFETMRQNNRVFTSMGAVFGIDFAITGGGDPEYVPGAVVTWDWMETLGLEPVQGRRFLPEEDQAGQPSDVVIIGHGLWQRRFGGADALGQEILLNDRPHTIVGVLSKDTQYPYQSELWVPMGLDADGPARNDHSLGVFGQMKPGVTLEQVNADLRRIYSELGEQFPESNANWGFELQLMRDELLRGIQPRLYMLLAAVGFLLLIACANVANMMLARAQEQTGEITLRLALGASRKQLITQLLSESIVVAILGGALGLVFAQFSLGPLVVLSPIAAMNTFYQDISIDWKVGLFTFLISLFVGVLFGLVPALRSTNPDLQSTLRDGGHRAGLGRSGRRLLAALVIFETALAMVLLVGAGLMIDSLRRLENTSPGFSPENLLTLRYNLPENRYPDHSSQLALLEPLLESLQGLSDVESASTGGALPLAILNSERRIGACTVEGRPLASANDFQIFNHRIVSPGYFETLGIPLIEGRTFSELDRPNSEPVVIVSKETARLYWPGESALGKRLKRGRADSDRPWMTIIGVVDDVADFGLDVDAAEVGPTWYLPYTQHSFRRLALTLKTRVPPRSVVNQVKEVTARFAPDLPLYQVETMEERLASSYQAKKFISVLLGFFGFLGLALAAIGIYGIMSYSVSQQRRDIGIRLALGASPSQVLGLVLAHGMKLAGLGLVIGLGVALILSRTLVRVYDSIDPGNFGAYVLMSLGLLAVALIASFIPARRAMVVDPMTTLRDE